MIVLDASAALSWVLLSQTTSAAEAFFRTDPSSLIAPAILAFEIRNALLRFERRRLVDSDQVDKASAALAALVELRSWRADSADFVRLLVLARQEGLSLFDAAYLDLAISEGSALASRDGPLLDAARRRGLQVHDLR